MYFILTECCSIQNKYFLLLEFIKYIPKKCILCKYQNVGIINYNANKKHRNTKKNLPVHHTYRVGTNFTNLL